MVLDALYNNKPVIVPRIDSFDFVEQYGVGVVYDNSFSEIVNLKGEKLKDKNYSCAISAFNSDMKRKTVRFLEFIRGDKK